MRVADTSYLDTLIEALEAGDLPEIPASLAPLVARAAARTPPADVRAWAEQLASDVAAAERDG